MSRTPRASIRSKATWKTIPIGRAASTRQPAEAAAAHRTGNKQELVMAGRKTHEQQLRTFERKPDVPDARQMEAALDRASDDRTSHPPRRDARQSEFPVSRGGVHQ